VRCGTGLARLAGEVKTDGGKGLAVGRGSGLDGGVQSSGPPPHPQLIQDAEHLKLLSVFHYVLAGLTALGGFFPLMYVAMGAMMVSGAFSGGGSAGAPPEAFGWFFVVIGALFSLLLWAFAVTLFLTARALAARRNRIFCLVIAAISCAGFPLGTALGVFTILVLQRPSIRHLFDGPPAEGGYLNR
jgi:hypothetical protein